MMHVFNLQLHRWSFERCVATLMLVLFSIYTLVKRVSETSIRQNAVLRPKPTAYYQRFRSDLGWKKGVNSTVSIDSYKYHIKRKLNPEHHLVGAADDDPRLLSYIRQHKIGPPSPMPYDILYTDRKDHSQYGQSIELDKQLNFMTNGFFIEVGAYDGERFSNTLYFERERNWTGLLIEVDPDIYKRLRKKRRKAWTVNACLSLTSNCTTAYFKRDDVFGRLASYRRGLKVQCYPLYSILLALNTTFVDLLSLDIEGDELKVLKTVPWDKVQIRMMMVEINHVDEGGRAVKDFMKKQGYTFVKEHLIDFIFVRKDLMDVPPSPYRRFLT